MIQLILTEVQEQLLTTSFEPVEVVDRRGRVLTQIRSNWTDDEIAEAMRKAHESGFATESIFETTERLMQDYPIPDSAKCAG